MNCQDIGGHEKQEMGFHILKSQPLRTTKKITNKILYHLVILVVMMIQISNSPDVSPPFIKRSPLRSHMGSPSILKLIEETCQKTWKFLLGIAVSDKNRIVLVFHLKILDHQRNSERILEIN